MIRIISITVICLLFCCNAAIAESSFYESQRQGWHWYAAPPLEIKEIEPLTDENFNNNDDSLIADIPALDDPKAELARLQETVETAKAQAILEPTPQNVKIYIELQNAIQAQASQFAQTWQTVLWANPELDHSLKNPTNQAARQIFNDQHRVEKVQAIEKWKQTHGLFYFFRSDCPYCQAFAPVLKQFEATYGINIIAISLDGQSLPEYPNARVDNGAAQRLGVSTVPALFAIEPSTQAIIPITYGLISMEDLTERLWQLSLLKEGVSVNE